jgi:hypothetical protein
MSVLWWILFAVIWIAIAFWPARVAGRKGHSFIGYFIFSLFFFPAAIIVAYLVHDRTQTPAGLPLLSGRRHERPDERGEDMAMLVICQARLEPQSNRRIKMPEVRRSRDG